MSKKIQYEIIGTKNSIDVNLKKETVWLSLMDLATLFDRDKSVISRHIGNIYKEKELAKSSTVAKIATVQQEGNRQIKRTVSHFNLDVIISVGYRVKSKRGTKFRIWATNIIKNEIVKNAQRKSIGKTQEEKYTQLVKMIDLAASSTRNKNISTTETQGILTVLQNYALALDTLDKYDNQTLKIESTKKNLVKELHYGEARKLIDDWKEVQNATDLFGNEKDGSFKSSLETIYQTFDGKDLYPSIEEKSANLLYYIVKNHSFSDGNKRIAAGLFIYFLDVNKHLYNKNGEKRIGNNALVAITIMVAESKPAEKDMMVKLVANLINENN